jgi:hypothetical protein
MNPQSNGARAPRRAGRARLHLPAHTSPKRRAPVLLALPDHSTVELIDTPWQPVINRPAALHASATGSATLAVNQVSRRDAHALRARWDADATRTHRFGSRTFVLALDGEPLAALTAANASEVEVDARLALYRSNCIELGALLRNPATHAHGSDTLLARVWREHLAVNDWPYYRQIRKVALICYRDRAGARTAIAAAEGWQPASHRGGLWVYWLAGRPASAPAAVAATRSTATGDVGALELVAA